MYNHVRTTFDGKFISIKCWHGYEIYEFLNPMEALNISTLHCFANIMARDLYFVSDLLRCSFLLYHFV